MRKVVLAFYQTPSLCICFFGFVRARPLLDNVLTECSMIVQEYDDKCPAPNTKVAMVRDVWLRYLTFAAYLLVSS